MHTTSTMNKTLLSLALLLPCTTLSAQTTDTPEVSDDVLRQFEGNYLFHGTNPACEAPLLAPNNYYECHIEACEGQLRMTGFIGDVLNESFPYYTGTYHPADGTISFICGPDIDGESVYDESNYCYYLYDFTLNVTTDADDRLTLYRPGEFWFYAKQQRNWRRASYSSLTFTKGATLPVWNGNINHLTTAETIDDLLTYTLEFENAHKIEASGFDITGIIYDATGRPYAMAIVNGIVDAIGSLTIRESRATIHFVKTANLSPQQRRQLPAHIDASAANKAVVYFSPKSFKVDGQIVNDAIRREVLLQE